MASKTIDAELKATEAELKRAGARWAKAKASERSAAELAYEWIQEGARLGLPQTVMAELVGVDRMTVRRALGQL